MHGAVSKTSGTKGSKRPKVKAVNCTNVKRMCLRKTMPKT